MTELQHWGPRQTFFVIPGRLYVSFIFAVFLFYSVLRKPNNWYQYNKNLKDIFIYRKYGSSKKKNNNKLEMWQL